MNSDANIAAHLSIGPKVNCQQNLIGSVELFLPASGGSRLRCQLSLLWKGVFDLD